MCACAMTFVTFSDECQRQANLNRQSWSSSVNLNVLLKSLRVSTVCYLMLGITLTTPLRKKKSNLWSMWRIFVPIAVRHLVYNPSQFNYFHLNKATDAINIKKILMIFYCWKFESSLDLSVLEKYFWTSLMGHMFSRPVMWATMDLLNNARLLFPVLSQFLTALLQ